VISSLDLLLGFGDRRGQGNYVFYCSRWSRQRDIKFRAVDRLRAFAVGRTCVTGKSKGDNLGSMRNKHDEVAIPANLGLEAGGISFFG
jgi:hypothetical protein